MTAVNRVLLAAMLLGVTSSVAIAQAPPPILQEPQTIRLWEGGRRVRSATIPKMFRR